MKRTKAQANELLRRMTKSGALWMIWPFFLLQASHAIAYEPDQSDEPQQGVNGGAADEAGATSEPFSGFTVFPDTPEEASPSLPDLEAESRQLAQTAPGAKEDEDQSETQIDSSEFDLFNFGYRGMDTSDPFRDNVVFFDYRTRRRDFFWPWEEASTRTLDGGFSAEIHDGSTEEQDFRASRLAGLLGKRILSDSYVEAGIGVHRLYIDGEKGSDVVYPVHLRGIFGIAHSLRAEYQADKDFVYDELIPGGISQALISTDQDLSLLWRPVERIRVTAAGGYRDLSDSNSRKNANFAVMYGISPEWPWIWLGIGGETLSYEDQTDNYWSPSRYAAYGFRLDSSFPVNDELDAEIAINLDRIVEEDGSDGNGGYVSAGLDYAFSSRLNLRAYVSRNRSLQRGLDWTENVYGLTISGALF